MPIGCDVSYVKSARALRPRPQKRGRGWCGFTSSMSSVMGIKNETSKGFPARVLPCFKRKDTPMAHRTKKYAAEFKQEKINNLAFAGPVARKAIVEAASISQWHKRVATNVKGFWVPANAKA